MTFAIRSGPAEAPLHLLLAHGAGANATSPFMEAMAVALAERGIAITRFEFGYMAARRTGGPRRPPPRAEALIPEYDAMLRSVAAGKPANQKLFIGGKSLGGRVASMIAGRAHAGGEIEGLVCLGYPFHPPGRPGETRTAHLLDLACPALIVQGERDPFGNRVEVSALALPGTISLVWLGDGDHDFGPRGNSGFARKGNLTLAADAVASFLAVRANVR